MAFAMITRRYRHATDRKSRHAGGRYGLLLLVLIATYLLSAFTTGQWVNGVQILAFVLTLLLAMRNALVQRRIARATVIVVLVGSAVAAGLVLSRPSDAAVGAAQIWTGLILLTTVAVIVRRILASTTVTLQSIYGALAAYMIIGLMFASFYGAMDHLGSGAFFANGSPDNTKTFQYFSFTTLTTLGYGDFTAASNAGRAVAVIEAMVGQIFLATLVARLVSAFRPSGPPDPPDAGEPGE
ncbi:MAG TPA: potassium channel family protein [Streptosporangiaceae bacterium]